jgi:hypothetical protein
MKKPMATSHNSNEEEGEGFSCFIRKSEFIEAWFAAKNLFDRRHADSIPASAICHQREISRLETISLTKIAI